MPDAGVHVTGPHTAGRSRLRALLPLLVAAVGAGIVAVTYFGDPAAPGSHFPTCPFKSLTGWDCPGCGSTRMLHELGHGHVGQALHYNALAVLAIPYLLYTYLAWTVEAWTGRRARRRTPSVPVIAAVGVLLLAWGVLRNVPVGPLRSLHV